MREIRRQFLKIMRLLKNKYILIPFIGVVLMIFIYTSYAFIRTELDWRTASQIKFSNLAYTLKINNTSTSTITSAANSGTVFYNVEITSLNETNTKYSLTYSSTNKDATVKISSLSLNDSFGVIGVYGGGSGTEKSKILRIAVTNDTDTDSTITLQVKGGYTWNTGGSVKPNSGYKVISGLHDETTALLGQSLPEILTSKLNCTPTATSPCLFKENATTNYVKYSGYNWKIMGLYLIGGELTPKLVLDSPLENSISYTDVSSTLSTFYNSLSEKILIRENSPFVCTGTTTISCSGSENIGLISKSEYDLIGKEKSYLYAKPNYDFWTNTASGSNYYVGTSRGIITQASTLTSKVRPSIYLINNTCNTGTGTISDSYEIGICHMLSMDMDGSTGITDYSGKYMTGAQINIGNNEPEKSNFSFLRWDVTGSGATFENGVFTIGTEDSTLNPILARNIGLNIEYTGVEKTIILQPGEYKIEAWGASGGDGDATNIGGYGGYSVGTISFDTETTLYINVGGKGNVVSPGGYNGGGNAAVYYAVQAASGGGATHVATSSGLLSTLSSNRSSILIVAGGGGGGNWYGNIDNRYSGTGGSGNGYIGGNGKYPATPAYGYGTGGSQSAAGYCVSITGYASGCTYGSFGLGATSGSGSAGGGGGYYGGGTMYHAAAGGGSGYIGNTNLTNKYMYTYCEIDCEQYEINTTEIKTIATTNVSHLPISNYAKFGDGFVRITKFLEGDEDLEYVTFLNRKGNKIAETSGYYAAGVSYSITEWDTTNGYDTISTIVSGMGYSVDRTKVTVGSTNATIIFDSILKKDFSLLSSEQTYEIPETGDYLLEVWGAQGAAVDTTYIGGYGGYSRGIFHLTEGTILHVNVGGKATNTSGGYNGGASGSLGSSVYGKGGGGATHIATAGGLLSTLSSDTSSILIVAGGGGGGTIYASSYHSTGGQGGGFIGGDPTNRTNNGTMAKGGTQINGGVGGTSSGTFGQGAIGTGASGGGGGGYWGGGGGNYSAGAGGSGYIGNANLTNKYMYTYCESDCINYESNTDQIKTFTTTNVSDTPTSDYAKSGDGYARLTIMQNHISGTSRTINFVLNGGLYMGSTTTFSDIYAQGSTYEIADPVKEGYIFAGWEITSGTGYTINGSNLTIGTTNATLTANWIAGSSFSCIASEQTYEIPETGNYLLEVWGAQGGAANATYIGGYGGYSRGIVHLTEGTTVYVNVGGEATHTPGGYNGGANGVVYNSYLSGGGGGATHISTTGGLLSTLSSNTSSILIVAGGGGGGTIYATSYHSTGGQGGGFIGGDPTNRTNNGTMAKGGTQINGGIGGTRPGTFGQGAIGSGGAGGGGGGYWGGGGGNYSAAGGGSGYIGNTNLTNKYMYTYCESNCEQYESDVVDTKTFTTTNVSDTPTSDYVKSKDGYAKITYFGS